MIRNCGCKINLGLAITGRLPDGYHSLDSIFYPLRYPCDTLLVEPAKVTELHCVPEFVDPEHNILAKTLKIFADATGIRPTLKIRLIKRIPVGAGLGGGSSDAANLLMLCNELHGSPLAREELVKLARKAGADVPFFLHNKACRLLGTGAELKPVNIRLNGWHLVLVWPDITVDTAWAFSAWDALRLSGNNLTKQIRADKNSSFCYGNGITAIADFQNDLELPVFSRYPLLAGLKQKILSQGARIAAMSGSGSSIYGLFDDIRTAERAALALRKNFSHVYRLQLA